MKVSELFNPEPQLSIEIATVSHPSNCVVTFEVAIFQVSIYFKKSSTFDADDLEIKPQSCFPHQLKSF